MAQFQDERLVSCVTTLAASFDLWEQTRRWCRERVLFGRPLSEMQVTQFKLVDLLTRLSAARELTHACIRKRIAGQDATLEISMAKLFCGRTVRAVADECLQLHGGLGYMKESAAGRAFVDSRLMSIGAGSDETMMHYMARLLRL
jgi:citronellyl-CoA dehydrogenase